MTPDGVGLVARNMFCSTCTPSVEIPGPADSFAPNAILIATSVGDEPRATVRVPASEAQGSYGVGDKIPGVGKIDADRLALDRRGRRIGTAWQARSTRSDRGGCSTGCGNTRPRPPRPIRSRAGSRRSTTTRSRSIATLVRELVTGAVKPGGMRDHTDARRTASSKGLKLFGVKGTTLANTVGLQNGDTLVAINNNKIKSAQSLLDVYTQLDTLNVVELDGTRGDKPLALTLRLR